MKKKLLLVNPIARWINRKSIFLKNYIAAPFQPLSLGVIAALTPDNWDIEIHDEIFKPFTYREADLVGITCFTGSATRAYEIAKICKSHGTPVVMGGIHVSQLPEEALQFADSVVVGEAEGVWGQLISDFESGNMQQIYKGEHLPMKNMPMPRHDLLGDGYMTTSVQTSRGCPMDCDFCSVSAFNGRDYRKRPVEEVLDELEKISQKRIFFLDDNFIEKGKEGEERALKLFKGMIDRKLNKYWGCQTSIRVADNEEVLHYAFKAGCRVMLLGIESEKETALKNLNKKINMNHFDHYDEVFKRIHKHRIGIIGTLIFGMDTDTADDLLQRARFIKKSRIDAVQPAILTPFPGTKLYDDFMKNNRILFTDYPADWGRYDWSDIVYTPALMSREEMKKTMIKCWESLGNWRTVVSKFLRTLYYTRSLETGLTMLNINYIYRTQYYFEKFQGKD